MGYGGRDFPRLAQVLQNSNDVGSGNAIAFSSTIALSGINKGVGFVNGSGNRFAAINAATADLTSPTFAFENDTIGLSSEFTAAQISAVQNSTRRHFIGSSTNLQQRFLAEYREEVSNFTVSQIPLVAQLTGGNITNVGATGLIVLELPNVGGQGNRLAIFNSSPSGTIRIRPHSSAAFITPTGKLPDGNYIELSDIGASINIVSNISFDWMVLSQEGDVNPQP